MTQTKSCPRLSGKVAAKPSKGASESRNEKSGFYRTVLNTCLSFLNEVMASEPFFEERSDAVKMSETPYPTNGSGKNLAEVARFKYSHLCTQACPFRLALLGTFSQRQSVSLCFRVAMLLKTQFACHRLRGKQRLRKKGFIVLKCITCLLYQKEWKP